VSTGQSERAARFRALHQGEPFLIPNPWDAGSARVLQALGFKALASSSSGLALSFGRLDGEVTLEEVVGHVRAVGRATELPLSVDLENGYGPEPEDAVRAIERVAEAGAIGGSIEDYERGDGLYEIGRATERVAAAAEAADRLGFPFTLTARAENHIRGNPDLDDTIARLLAEEIRTVCDAVSRPVNVLAHSGLSLSMAEIVEAGAQRVSLGGSLAWTAVEAMAASAEAIRDRGDFSSLGSMSAVREWLGG
jgi:2-methylisocitrate lyase-like PEP mutase family enzyme